MVAGILDLLFAEQRTLDADGFDAYADGGGLLGALPGGLAQVLGRWGALVVLVLLGVVVGQPHQRMVAAPDGSARRRDVHSPAVRAAGAVVLGPVQPGRRRST